MIIVLKLVEKAGVDGLLDFNGGATFFEAIYYRDQLGLHRTIVG